MWREIGRVREEKKKERREGGGDRGCGGMEGE